MLCRLPGKVHRVTSGSTNSPIVHLRFWCVCVTIGPRGRVHNYVNLLIPLQPIFPTHYASSHQLRQLTGLNTIQRQLSFWPEFCVPRAPHPPLGIGWLALTSLHFPLLFLVPCQGLPLISCQVNLWIYFWLDLDKLPTKTQEPLLQTMESTPWF